MRSTPEPNRPTPHATKQSGTKMHAVANGTAADAVFTADELAMAQHLALENRKRSIAALWALANVLSASRKVLRALSHSAEMAWDGSPHGDEVRREAAETAKNELRENKEALDGLKTELHELNQCVQDFVSKANSEVLVPTEEAISLAIQIDLNIQSKKNQDNSILSEAMVSVIGKARKASDILAWQIRKFRLEQEWKLFSEMVLAKVATKRGMAAMALLAGLWIASIELYYPRNESGEATSASKANPVKPTNAAHPFIVPATEKLMPGQPPEAKESGALPDQATKLMPGQPPEAKESGALPDLGNEEVRSKKTVISSDPKKMKESVFALKEAIEEWNKSGEASRKKGK